MRFWMEGRDISSLADGRGLKERLRKSSVERRGTYGRESSFYFNYSWPVDGTRGVRNRECKDQGYQHLVCNGVRASSPSVPVGVTKRKRLYRRRINASHGQLYR